MDNLTGTWIKGHGQVLIQKNILQIIMKVYAKPCSVWCIFIEVLCAKSESQICILKLFCFSSLKLQFLLVCKAKLIVQIFVQNPNAKLRLPNFKTQRWETFLTANLDNYSNKILLLLTCLIFNMIFFYLSGLWLPINCQHYLVVWLMKHHVSTL